MTLASCFPYPTSMTHDPKDPFPTPGGVAQPVSSSMIVDETIPSALESAALPVDSSALIDVDSNIPAALESMALPVDSSALIEVDSARFPDEEVTVLREVADLMSASARSTPASSAPGPRSVPRPAPQNVQAAHKPPPLSVPPPSMPPASVPPITRRDPLSSGHQTPSYTAEVWARGVSRAPSPSSFPVPAPRIGPQARIPSVRPSSLPPVTPRMSQQTQGSSLGKGLAWAAGILAVSGIGGYLLGKSNNFGQSSARNNPPPVAPVAPAVQAPPAVIAVDTQVEALPYACEMGALEKIAPSVEVSRGVSVRISDNAFAVLVASATGKDALYRRTLEEGKASWVATVESEPSRVPNRIDKVEAAIGTDSTNLWSLEKRGNTMSSELGAERSELDRAFILGSPVIAKFGGSLYAAWSRQEEADGPWAIRMVQLNRDNKVSQRPWPQDPVSSMSPQIAPLADGGALLVWAEEKGEGARVVAQAMRRDGTLSGERILVSPPGIDAGQPKVAVMDAKDVGVAYMTAAGETSSVAFAHISCKAIRP